MKCEFDSPDEDQSAATFAGGMLTECTGDPLLRSAAADDLPASMNPVRGNRRLPPPVEASEWTS